MKIENRSGLTSSLCGIVLAGGEGKRLESFVQRIKGRRLPKQFVNFIGRRSMLEHTVDRAEKLISAERLFVVVNREHLRHPEVRQQLSGRAKETVVVQPENKETAPGLLLPLMHVYHRYPKATVVVFPSDHFVLEEDRWVSYVYLTCCALERAPWGLVLLGVEPEEAEEEYGYILPGDEVEGLSGLKMKRVSSFVEKPKARELRELLVRGALWNTMVMVFKPATLLDLVARIAPSLYAFFKRVGEAFGSSKERQVVEEAYRQMEPVNFSKGVLEVLPQRSPRSLLTLPVRGVHWSDWGSSRRVVSVLSRTGYLARVRGVAERELFKALS
ncbi:MAG: NTP transferase domain-containing protein [Deltaproteobacteria bacterium]|nr:NTP transferase domain-containing protein [Deltaproteobacteria bacterium]